MPDQDAWGLMEVGIPKNFVEWVKRHVLPIVSLLLIVAVIVTVGGVIVHDAMTQPLRYTVVMHGCDPGLDEKVWYTSQRVIFYGQGNSVEVVFQTPLVLLNSEHAVSSQSITSGLLVTKECQMKIDRLPSDIPSRRWP